MYLRHTTVRKKGKTHSYWRLVRSVRRGRKVVQETVAQLGELDARGRARARSLALRITGRGEQYELFEAPAEPGAPVAVRLEQIRLERARRAAGTPLPSRRPGRPHFGAARAGASSAIYSYSLRFGVAHDAGAKLS